MEIISRERRSFDQSASPALALSRHGTDSLLTFSDIPIFISIEHKNGWEGGERAGATGSVGKQMAEQQL